MQDEPTSPKPKRITLNRMEAFTVIEKLKAIPDTATTPLDILVSGILAYTGIETTPGIIRGLLKQLNIPHVSFRSTPKPGAVDIEALTARVEHLDKTVEDMALHGIPAMKFRIKELEEIIGFIGAKIDAVKSEQDTKIAFLNDAVNDRFDQIKQDIVKIDRALSAIPKP